MGLKTWGKRVVRGILHRTGAWAVYHARANRRCLTVVSFHRVLPRDDPRYASAHPVWTVSLDLFTRCVEFFARHYNPVSLETVLKALRGQERLPDRALLITFDDGWSDNADHALPVLQRHGMPAVIFVVAEILKTGRLWQEPILLAWEEGRIPESCRSRFRLRDRDALQNLLSRTASLDETSRDCLVAELCPLPEQVPVKQMLCPEQLQRLRRSGISIGSHGLTHSPLAVVNDPARELQLSRDILQREIGEPVTTISFPHGSYDDRLRQEAGLAGYEALFTSEACLNAAVEGRNLPALLGRIPMIASDICDEKGEFSSELLARWLFLRPGKTLGPINKQ